MGTIADKLNYLNTTKANIKSAIINKGVSVSDSDTFRSYADKIASIGADAYTIVDDTTPASLKTVSTAPYPMGACKVGIEAVQEGSGTPSPDNVRPIVGWDAVNLNVCARNLFNPGMNTYYNYYNDEGVEQTSYTTGHSDLQKIKSSTPYYLLLYSTSGRQAGGRQGVYFWDENRQFISRITQNWGADELVKLSFTTPSNCKYISYQLPVGTSVELAGFDITKCYLYENGSASDVYEAYNGTTYTENLATTNYGGYWDAVAGEIGTKHASVDLGTLDWVYVSGSGIMQAGTGTWTENIMKLYDTNVVPDWMCENYDIYKTVTTANWANANNGTIGTKPNTTIICIKDNRYTDATEFKTAMDGVKLVYELATSTTTATTPRVINTNDGTTNVWADSGKIERAKYLTPLS